jgi:hypothetical protein
MWSESMISFRKRNVVIILLLLCNKIKTLTRKMYMIKIFLIFFTDTITVVDNKGYNLLDIRNGWKKQETDTKCYLGDCKETTMSKTSGKIIKQMWWNFLLEFWIILNSLQDRDVHPAFAFVLFHPGQFLHTAPYVGYLECTQNYWVFGLFYRLVLYRTRRFGNCICFRPQAKVGEKTQPQNPVILCVIHHRQNHLESA